MTIQNFILEMKQIQFFLSELNSIDHLNVLTHIFDI